MASGDTCASGSAKCALTTCTSAGTGSAGTSSSFVGDYCIETAGLAKSTVAASGDAKTNGCSTTATGGCPASGAATLAASAAAVATAIYTLA